MKDEQYQRLSTRFDNVDERLCEHDKQFAQVNERFGELEQRLDEHGKRFDAIDMRFGKVETTPREQDKTIETLYVHVEQRFAQLDTKIDATKDELKADISRVLNLLEEDLKRRETDDHERLAMNHQLDQHEDWIERAAGQLKIKYDRAA